MSLAASDGNIDGNKLGASDGTKLGMSESSDAGVMSDGATDGDKLGASEGAVPGVSETVTPEIVGSDGNMDGDKLGPSESIFLGLVWIDGCRDGAMLGKSEGALVRSKPGRAALDGNTDGNQCGRSEATVPGKSETTTPGFTTFDERVGGESLGTSEGAKFGESVTIRIVASEGVAAVFAFVDALLGVSNNRLLSSITVIRFSSLFANLVLRCCASRDFHPLCSKPNLLSFATVAELAHASNKAKTKTLTLIVLLT